MEKVKKEVEQQLISKLEDGGGRGVYGGGVTFVLILSICVAVCGSFVGGCVVGYSSPAQSGIMADLGLSTADYSLFGSMVTVGGLLSSLLCGKITDYIGRRLALGLSADVLFLLGWLFIAFSQAAWSLDLGRLLTGSGLGLITYVINVYISEISPRNLRGGLVLIHQLMFFFGQALSFIAGLIATWRVLAFIAVGVTAIQLFDLFFIPESPRWLVKVRHDDKSYEAVLQGLRGENVDISLETSEIKEQFAAVESISKDSVLDIFQMKYAFSLTVILGLVILGSCSGGFGIVFYASKLFESAGVSGPLGSITLALIPIPPAILSVFLMDNYGRRPLLLCSAGGMCVGCLSVALSFLMKGHGWMPGLHPYLALTGILMHSAANPIGFAGIPSLLMTEMFPMNVKGAAGSLVAITNSLVGWVVSYSFNFMLDWSSLGTFFIFTFINLFTVVFVSKLVPETKGRTLEEIQESLTHSM